MKLDDYIGPDSAICVPLVVSDAGTLEMRIFARPADVNQDSIENVGWLSIQKYGGILRTYFDNFLKEANADELRRETILETIEKEIRTLQHITRKPAAFEQVIVLPPRTNADWVCPVEWLRTVHPASGKPSPSLLELARTGILFATGRYPPLLGETVKLEPEDFEIHAGNQEIGGESLHRLVAGRLGEEVAAFEFRVPKRVSRPAQSSSLMPTLRENWLMPSSNGIFPTPPP